MQTRHRLLLVGLVGVWIGIASQGVVSARDTYHICDDLCGVTAATCDHECWLTQEDFDNDYPATSCGAEGYECCGDGVCNPAVEGCNVCVEDCGAVSDCYPGECLENGDCAGGDVCNARHECVAITGGQSGGHTPYCGGSCSSNENCCGGDTCLGSLASGGKYCGIPASNYCPDAPACSGSGWTNCDFSGICPEAALDMYCDPGIDRCMFNLGPACPSLTSMNMCVPY